VTEDQDTQMKTNISVIKALNNAIFVDTHLAKDWDWALISATTFYPQPHISLVNQSLALSMSLTLEDYNKKAHNSELATVPCLHGYRSTMVGIAVLAHKLVQ